MYYRHLCTRIIYNCQGIPCDMIPETTLTLAVVGMPSILALCSASFLAILSLSSSVFSGILDLGGKREREWSGVMSYEKTEQIILLWFNFWHFFVHLSSFLLIFSSAFSFWAEVRLSASARLSTAMAKKTLRRMSDV